MLDAETKRKIDSARDILVGIVPDPKAQVEQITIALIYKFMDDMDKESQELGGKAKYFSGGFTKYAWHKLLDRRLSGPERLDLYTQAITRMSNNPHIPQLFRDIFKGAFLPHNNPATLSLFLKEIDGFVYDHSENLGNAFEYLLSVLGSQGNAGQFRTPRHIIDFIVEVVAPRKGETILDPACGTAGFLISAYKHILRQNSSAAGENESPAGDLLTLDEKKALPRNIAGYDISPDMVKLSLVNMYLHQFPDPKIEEYDTLTDDKHWDTRFDVILANPPFMTPKGGIRPHGRFSLQANRSEVLFVDYILEHLNHAAGRAGIIVPEGIIFKTETAYKKLRKALVTDGLFAVVSLPPGVFNPYSGVKTSILFFDNQCAKKSDEILFVKVENDGLDLGAKRLPIEANDLPKVLEILEAWKVGGKKKSGAVLWVKKQRILENDIYDLTGERYKKTEIRKNLKHPEVELGEMIEVITPPGKIKASDFSEFGIYPIADQSQKYIAGWSNDENALIKSDKPLIVFGDHTCVVKYFDIPFIQGADGIKILKTDEKLLPKFLYYLLKNRPIKSDGYKRHFTKLRRHVIPLPPLTIQKEIVEEIETKQRAMDHAREVIKNLEKERENFSREVRRLGEFERIRLEQVTQLERGVTYRKSDEVENNGYKILRANNISLVGDLVFTDIKQISRDVKLRDSQRLKANDILICLASGSKSHIGKVVFIKSDMDFYFGGFMGAIRISQDNLLPKYLHCLLQERKFNEYLRQMIRGANINNLSAKILGAYEILLPPLAVQKQLVIQIEKEEKIIAANKQLIELMEQKIANIIGSI